jgi:hypothetical protein
MGIKRGLPFASSRHTQLVQVKWRKGYGLSDGRRNEWRKSPVLPLEPFKGRVFKRDRKVIDHFFGTVLSGLRHSHSHGRDPKFFIDHYGFLLGRPEEAAKSSP